MTGSESTRRIAMLPGSVSRRAGGLFTSVRRLSESIRCTRGAIVDVIGNRDGSTDEDVSQWEMKPHLIPSRGLLENAKQSVKVLKRLKPDVIHTQFIWSYGSLATVRYHQKTKTPYVISPRGMLDPWAVGHHRWRKKIASAFFEAKHLRRAACLHALCDSEADAMRSYGLSNRIEIVPNGIDLPETASLEQFARCRSDNPSGKRQLLFLGRLHEKKAVHHLLDAWAHLNHASEREFTREWGLTIAGFGDSTYEDRLQRQIKEKGLESSVRWAGPLLGDAKVNALGSADAFILPSYSEGLPMSILEAWAYKLPVLMTPYCNLPIGFDRNAAISIGTDKSSIATGILDLFRMTDEQRLNMGDAGFDLVKERFQWSAIARQMSDIYHSL